MGTFSQSALIQTIIIIFARNFNQMNRTFGLFICLFLSVTMYSQIHEVGVWAEVTT
jgi:hypothetical protein